MHRQHDGRGQSGEHLTGLEDRRMSAHVYIRPGNSSITPRSVVTSPIKQDPGQEKSKTRIIKARREF